MDFSEAANIAAQNAAAMQESAKLIGTGLAVGMGVIGSGIGEGIAAGMALSAMARNPELKNELFTKLIVTMAITESSAIYAVVFGLLMLFRA